MYVERPISLKKPLIPTWLGTLVIILIVLSFLMALMLWKPWEPVKPKTQTSAESVQDTNKDYRFYDLLPQQQVTPIPEQAVPENKNQDTVVIVEAPFDLNLHLRRPRLDLSLEASEAPVAAPASYILQVRSFDDPDQADAAVLKLFSMVYLPMWYAV